MKKLLNRIFVDGLSGMASGLFATLIIGTIIQQIGNLIGGNIGTLLYQFGKMAAAMTSAGIGVGVACRFNILCTLFLQIPKVKKHSFTHKILIHR